MVAKVQFVLAVLERKVYLSRLGESVDLLAFLAAVLALQSHEKVLVLSLVGNDVNLLLEDALINKRYHVLYQLFFSISQQSRLLIEESEL